MEMCVAQIAGFTMSGSITEIQTQWDELKQTMRFAVLGETLRFYKARIHNGCAVVVDHTPTKEVVFNG